MTGAIDGVRDVAVLLLDRKVKTELLFPTFGFNGCSGEDVAGYEDASEPEGV